jgi:hypothetical protein
MTTVRPTAATDPVTRFEMTVGIGAQLPPPQNSLPGISLSQRQTAVLIAYLESLRAAE